MRSSKAGTSVRSSSREVRPASSRDQSSSLSTMRESRSASAESIATHWRTSSGPSALPARRVSAKRRTPVSGVRSSCEMFATKSVFSRDSL